MKHRDRLSPQVQREIEVALTEATARIKASTETEVYLRRRSKDELVLTVQGRRYAIRVVEV